MEIKNFFKMNDWDIKSFLVVIFSIQLAYLGTFSMNKLGIEIPFLRQILGFVYITFIPGYLLLRILRIHKLSSEESLLYALGLSLFFDMFVGLLMNTFYPMLGITDKPISEIPIVVTFTLAISILSLLAYFRDRNYSIPSSIEFRDILSLHVLLLSLIPFVAIFGAYIIRHYRSNILSMITFLSIGIILIVVGSTLHKSQGYSFTLWIISISLILSFSCISPYIPVGDVVGEYFIAKSTISHKYWGPLNLEYLIEHMPPVSTNYNSVLSDTILPAIYFYVGNFSLDDVFKFIFPLLFSFLPIGTYTIFHNLFKNRSIAFLSSALLISSATFYRIVALTLTKQAIAEIFFVLILLYLFSSNKNKLLGIVLIWGLIWSHYGLAFLVLGNMILILVVMSITNILPSPDRRHLTHLAILYIISIFSWYSLLFISSVFDSIVNLVIIGFQEIQNLFTFKQSRPVFLVTSSNYNIILKVYYMFIQAVIVFAIFKTILNKIRHKHDFYNVPSLYLLVTIYWVMFLAVPIFIPQFGAIDTKRTLHISLFTSAPFFIMGVRYLADYLSSRVFKLDFWRPLSSTIIAGFLITNITSIAILHSPSSSMNIYEKARYYSGVLNTHNVVSGKWISFSCNNEVNIYRFDVFEGYPSLTVYGNCNANIYSIEPHIKTIHNGYIYLDFANLHDRVGWKWYNPLQAMMPFEFSPIYQAQITILNNKIYDNGGSQVLWIS